MSAVGLHSYVVSICFVGLFINDVIVVTLLRVTEVVVLASLSETVTQSIFM